MKIEMDPHSITMRIKKTSELRRLCIAIGGERLKERLRNDPIRKVSPDEPYKPADKVVPVRKVL